MVQDLTQDLTQYLTQDLTQDLTRIALKLLLRISFSISLRISLKISLRISFSISFRISIKISLRTHSGLVWRSQTRIVRKACGGSGDMDIPNLFWRNVEVVSAPPPLYLNFYRKLAMTAKPSVERVADRYGTCYLWLWRPIPGNLQQ